MPEAPGEPEVSAPGAGHGEVDPDEAVVGAGEGEVADEAEQRAVGRGPEDAVVEDAEVA